MRISELKKISDDYKIIKCIKYELWESPFYRKLLNNYKSDDPTVEELYFYLDSALIKELGKEDNPVLSMIKNKELIEPIKLFSKRVWNNRDYWRENTKYEKKNLPIQEKLQRKIGFRDLTPMFNEAQIEENTRIAIHDLLQKRKDLLELIAVREQSVVSNVNLIDDIYDIIKDMIISEINNENVCFVDLLFICRLAGIIFGDRLYWMSDCNTSDGDIKRLCPVFSIKRQAMLNTMNENEMCEEYDEGNINLD